MRLKLSEMVCEEISRREKSLGQMAPSHRVVPEIPLRLRLNTGVGHPESMVGES